MRVDVLPGDCSRRDSGIWELDQVEHYTFSKIGCWIALNAAVKLADDGQIDAVRVDRWKRERDRIRGWINVNCWSEAKQAYTFYPGTDRLDAAMLLAARFDFPEPARLANTREAIRSELSSGPHVYRYSGAADEEGAFVACGFWISEGYAVAGERELAVGQMDGMLAACGGNLGLLNEQVDPADGSGLGNFPQALSHLALIHAACALGDGLSAV